MNQLWYKILMSELIWHWLAKDSMYGENSLWLRTGYLAIINKNTVRKTTSLQRLLYPLHLSVVCHIVACCKRLNNFAPTGADTPSPPPDQTATCCGRYAFPTDMPGDMLNAMRGADTTLIVWFHGNFSEKIALWELMINKWHSWSENASTCWKTICRHNSWCCRMMSLVNNHQARLAT